MMLFSSTRTPRQEHLPNLTVREFEILQLLAQAYSSQEIARQLGITQFTVRSHICRILKKLHLRNRTEAAIYLMRHQELGSYAPEILLKKPRSSARTLNGTVLRD